MPCLRIGRFSIARGNVENARSWLAGTHEFFGHNVCAPVARRLRGLLSHASVPEFLWPILLCGY